MLRWFQQRLAVRAGLAGLVLLNCILGQAQARSPVDFNREIRPILSDYCFACHGPDEKTRKAGLRLDLKTGATQPNRKGIPAVVPGHPERSLLLERIASHDPDDLMPPPTTGKTLKPAQIEAFRRWIADGADWPEHWAFVAPRPPKPPPVKNQRWPRNPIDQFVLADLERQGLTPSPETDPVTLARRTTLDLTGLPPTIEEVDALLADRSPDAQQHLVDRLLASPRYGEHMARAWLDAVRYADSHGYHIDSQRDLWAYRDWVVEAFNANKPFDQFATEQLAGDLLPNSTPEQKVATGFIRSNMTTGEGGAIDAEYAAKYAFDRTETTGTLFLGLTLTCARCHTHKYDPITQREYYQLLAFFNQLDEPVMDGNRPNPDPFIKLPSPQQSERLAWLAEHLREADQQLAAPVSDLDAAQSAWAESWHQRLRAAWQPLAANRLASPHGTSLRQLEDHSILAEGPCPDTDSYEFTVPLDAGPLAALRLEALPHAALPKQSASRAADGRFRLSEIQVDLVLPGDDPKPPEPKRLQFRPVLASSFEPGFEPDKVTDGKAETAWSPAGTADPSQAHSLLLTLNDQVSIPPGASLRCQLRFEADNDRHMLGHFRLSAVREHELAGLLHPPRFQAWQLVGPFKTAGLKLGYDQPFDPESDVDLTRTYAGVREEIRWQARPDLEDGKTHLLVNELHGVHGAYYLTRVIQLETPAEVDLSLRADDVFKLWLNGELVMTRDSPDRERGVASRRRLALPAGESRLLLKIVNHQGAKSFAFDARLAGPDRLRPETAAILSATANPAGGWGDWVRSDYRYQHSPALRDLANRAAAWREEQTAIESSIPTTLVAKELATPRETRLLQRGEYDKPGDLVSAGVPAILSAWPTAAPTNRLGLAQWLLAPNHPLTARVTVNRFWQQFFGVGLVKTAEDFGVQGERPSHPELLDWLATEFVRSGWNVKYLQRLIVTSATYRQGSAASPSLLARDPENRWLARGPRFRLEAESLRDTLLAVSGLLVEQRGGPSVKPFEPPGLWEAVSFNNAQKYVQDRGPANYRRSLYTHWKRQSPPPNMLIFDAPTREYCVVRRPRTNTPLQALVLLNDPQFVEAARALATRMLQEGGPDSTPRLAHGFRLATGRLPNRAELRVLETLLTQQLAAYRQDPAAAEQYLGVGEFRPAVAVPPTELAAWTTVASLLLNLDEVVTKS